MHGMSSIKNDLTVDNLPMNPVIEDKGPLGDIENRVVSSPQSGDFTRRASQDLISNPPSVDEGSEEIEREGRFHGPDSSWRFYTRDIRDLAESLDSLENNNLAIHLYNAHALKARLHSQDDRHQIQSFKSKRDWAVQSRDKVKTFSPPNVWTAWPVLPEDVPRQRETWGVPTQHPHEQPGTYFREENWRPSLFLEEEIHAFSMRLATLYLRQQRQVDLSNKLTLADQSSLRTSGNGSSPDDTTENEAGILSDEGTQHNSAEPSEPLTQEAEDAEQGLSHHSEEYYTSVSTDEEKNNQLLKLTTRHILAKLDDLLLGLHRSRQGHRLSHTGFRGAKGGFQPRSKLKPTVRGQARSPTKRTRLNTYPESEIKQDYQSTVPRARVKSRSRSRPTSSSKPASLGLRDWSETLSVAALVGWDPKVVDRAAQRCASIFGEGMVIRTMPEDALEVSNDLVKRYAPGMVQTSNLSRDVHQARTEDLKVDLGFSCPYIRCSRHLDAYKQRWRLNEHLKGKHSLRSQHILKIGLSEPIDLKAESGADQ